MLSTKGTRPALLAVRALQWSSAVIVMGITSYFISKYQKGEHVIYQEVIACMSVAFFIPAFISPFMPSTLSKAVLSIDIAFSYLWLTSFIFAAQDYNWQNCLANAPPGARCSLKRANEAFIFLSFFCTFTAIFLEVSNLWAFKKENDAPLHEKQAPGNAPLDAPADAPATV